MQNFILAYTYLFVEIMYSDHLLRPAWHHSFPPVIYRWRVCQHWLTWSTTHRELNFKIFLIFQDNFLLMPSEGFTMMVFPLYNLFGWDKTNCLSEFRKKGSSTRMPSFGSLLLMLFKPSNTWNTKLMSKAGFNIFFIKHLPFKNASNSDFYLKCKKL